MGISTFIGIGACLLQILPLVNLYAKFTSKCRKSIAVLTDKRVRLMDEIICGIKVNNLIYTYIYFIYIMYI